MIEPTTILQIDSRWSKVRYALNDNDRVGGEIANIGNSGCGPACMAMIIVTLTGNESVTPVTLCKWALQRGYKLQGQGTSYDYFVPQGRAYDITISRMNTVNNYHNGSNAIAKTVRGKVIDEITNKGNWVIAVMGPSIWTTWGHYVIAYGSEDDKVYIKDPANITKMECMVADKETFLDNAKYFWLVDVNKYLKSHKDRKATLDPDPVPEVKPTPAPVTPAPVTSNTSSNSTTNVVKKSINIFNNTFEVPTVKVSGKSYISPEVLSNIGLDVSYDASVDEYTIKTKTIKVNNQLYEGFHDNGRAFISFEDYEKAIGSDVGWDSKNQSIIVIRKK